jgi:drug/metabolite transporter (DMT)-like permease
MTGASLTLGTRAALTGGIDLGFRLDGWLWIVCIGVISTVLAMLAFFAGLRRVGPSGAAIMSMFEPVVTTGLAALTLKEFLAPVQLGGAVVVLASAVLVQLRRGTGGTEQEVQEVQDGVRAPAVEAVPLG